MYGREIVAFLFMITAIIVSIALLRKFKAPHYAFYVVLPLVNIISSFMYAWAYSITDSLLILLGTTAFGISGVIASYVFTHYL